MNKIAKFNDGYQYIFVAVDTLSRMLYAEPMKSKTSRDTLAAFKNILSRTHPAKPLKLWIDEGKEFAGEFKKFCNESNIHIYSTFSEKKSAFAERNIRSLKSLIYRYLDANNTNRYIDILQEFVGTINNRVNRMTGLAPTKVTADDEPKLIALCTSNQSAKPKFKVGDTVRMSKKTECFMKGYSQQFTTETFVISDICSLNPPTYQLTDGNNDVIAGKFYEPELVKYTPK